MEYNMSRPLTATVNHAAALFERELMKDIRSLPPELHTAINRCVKDCDATGESFTALFSKVRIRPNWRRPLLEIAGRAEVQLQRWQEKNQTYGYGLDDYRHIDEIGRVYRRISLAASEKGKGHVFPLPHLPSEDQKPVFTPLLGWAKTKEEMDALVDSDLISYGLERWDTICEKEFLLKF